MGKPVLLILSHAIEEHDQVELLSSLGYDVFSLGGYIDPSAPHVPIRPPVPEAPRHPELKAIVDGLGAEDNIGAAASHIPDGILEWLGDDGIIIAHHYLEQRIYPQWDRLRDWMRGAPGRRIIRRTVGQSVAHNEEMAAGPRADGMEIVRYSPRERAIPGYAGEDALIRFWVDGSAYGGWVGDVSAVGNVTQKLWLRSLGDDGLPAPRQWTNHRFAAEATEGLPASFAGPGSDADPYIPGLGELSWDDMRDYLRHVRVYLYTGTQPASYTLGLIEAMMTGVPVVSIGPSWFDIFPYGSDLFEAHELATAWSDDPQQARGLLKVFLDDAAFAAEASADIRARAVSTFDRDTVGAAWQAFLG